MKKSSLFWLILLAIMLIFIVIKYLIPVFHQYEEVRITVYIISVILAIVYFIMCIENAYCHSTYPSRYALFFRKINFIYQINTLIDKTIPSLINKNKKS